MHRFRRQFKIHHQTQQQKQFNDTEKAIYNVLNSLNNMGFIGIKSMLEIVDAAESYAFLAIGKGHITQENSIPVLKSYLQEHLQQQKHNNAEMHTALVRQLKIMIDTSLCD